MESNLNITGPNWSAFPYQFPHSLGPSHGFARQNSSCFFGIPCLKWPSLAKKSLEESVTRTVYPMVFGFAWRKCWNIMEHLLPSAFRTTAFWGPKREMCLFVLWTSYPMITTHSEGITGSTLPVRASKMLHFFHVDFARPNLDRCSKALGEKCSKRVYLEDPGRTAPQIVIGELFFWLYCNPVLNGINPLGGLPGCLTSY